MSKLLKGAALGVAASALLSVSPVFAQKSKDTLRSVSFEPISILDDVFNAQPSSRQITQAIFDQLAQFDWEQKKWVPSIAKSWNFIDDRTVEFELRDDVKYHNGEKMTADDWVAKFQLLIDPSIK